MKKTGPFTVASHDCLLRGAAAAFLSRALCPGASAQVSGLPHADTHARPPEAVMADRKDWGADFSFVGPKISWDDEYNNEPQPGVKRNDTVVMTSLTLHLGR